MKSLTVVAVALFSFVTPSLSRADSLIYWCACVAGKPKPEYGAPSAEGKVLAGFSIHSFDEAMESLTSAHFCREETVACGRGRDTLREKQKELEEKHGGQER